jgi:peptidoglycan-associated lipoprotein
MEKKYPLGAIIATVCILVLLFSCGTKKGTMEAAREAFAKKEYYVAGENYKAVFAKTKNKDVKNEASFKTAECYRLSNDIKNAENWYRKTAKADPKNAEAVLRLAQTLKSNQKFTEAIVEFNKYKQLNPSDPRVDEEIKGAEYALKWKTEKTRYVIENVKSINSKWSDFAANWYRKDRLYFTSDRDKGVNSKIYGWTGNQFTDLWYVTFKVDRKNHNSIKYGIPALVDKDKVNTPYNDGTAEFDKRFSTIYYTQCSGRDGKGKNCRIYSATAAGTEWNDPEPLSFSSDSFTCGHPSLTQDGAIMYFASDMPGGFGGKDIWYVTYTKRGKTWGDPINLGPTINTEGDEVYPFIHPDGTLYFASDGHVGIGGKDLFYSKGSGTDWSTPVNMKSPLNSGGDDFALILSPDKENGYFSSNREGGRGQDDIYRFYLTPLVFTLSGTVKDSKTQELLTNSVITLTNSSDSVKLILRTDESGSYKVTLQPRTDYELFAAHEDYLDSRLEFQTTKGLEVSTDLIQNFVLDPFDYQATIKVEGIYYDLDKADIRADAAPILDSLILVLNKYPKIRIELGSHTDCRNDSIYNQALSQRRADSAVGYLVRNGVDSARLVARGFGEAKLTNDCACEGSFVKRRCTEAEHQLNRRTTVRFLDNKYKPKGRGEMLENKDKSVAPPNKSKRPGTSPRR